MAQQHRHGPYKNTATGVPWPDLAHNFYRTKIYCTRRNTHPTQTQKFKTSLILILRYLHLGPTRHVENNNDKADTVLRYYETVCYGCQCHAGIHKKSMQRNVATCVQQHSHCVGRQNQNSFVCRIHKTRLCVERPLRHLRCSSNNPLCNDHWGNNASFTSVRHRPSGRMSE